jgi:hypothetical protein
MQLPQTWTDALRALQTNGFPEAVIAGGALRDLDNGREVKDVDIFVQWRGSDTPLAIAQALGATHRVSTVTPESVCEYLENLADVKGIYAADLKALEAEELSFGLFDPIPPALAPVQIIALEPFTDLMGVLRRIDFGLCQIGFDGQRVLKTPAYTADKYAKQMTVLRCDSTGQMLRTLKRFKRLSEKYSGFELSIPLEFQLYAATTS